MQFTDAIYTNADNSQINVSIDGEKKFVPASPENPHFVEMQRQGVPIADYVPSLVEQYPPLTRFQFSVALNLMGKSIDDLKAAINGAISDPIQKAVAMAAIENPPGDHYNRDNALFAHPDILAALGLTAAQIDATWNQVKAIQSV